LSVAETGERVALIVQAKTDIFAGSASGADSLSGGNISRTNPAWAAQTAEPNEIDEGFRGLMVDQGGILMRQMKGRRVFNSVVKLAVDANQVVGLRMMKLMRGGRQAGREAELMVTEKMDAAFEAGTRLLAGASGDEIVRRYRLRGAANAKRLKRTRRRRK
jgi:hypothetical protein